MVRHYIKKNVCSKYSQENLNLAIDAVKLGRSSIYAASKRYEIPYPTLYSRVKGTRGKISKRKGRPITIPLEQETKLANGIKYLNKWGFGLSRKEILELVGTYVNENQIKTNFNKGVPGEDWFLNFKQRHRLSLKTPQNVEYSHRKAMDPFIIFGYFDLLKTKMDELDLHQKPSHIWNLDETSLSMDPRKSKVLGEIGQPTSRTISTPGKENVTILAMCNANGEKAPPLIIYKGRHLWDQWVAPDDSQFPGTVYAATQKGWMDKVFKNYFMKVIIPLVGCRTPALIIFDGHSTHVNVDIIEAAINANITILKLPPHSSHLLQPLDLAVFRPFKLKWDEKLITWQRKHVGHKLPKKIFSMFLGETWKSINPQVIKNGFKKAGIMSFNKLVIPETAFPQDSYQRWLNIQNSSLESHITADSENQPPEPSTSENGNLSGSTEPRTVNKNVETQLEPSCSSSFNAQKAKSFEDLLLSTVRQNPNAGKQRRTRVCLGSEVLTTAEVVSRLKDKPILNRVQAKGSKQKKKCKESDSSDDDIDENVVIYDESDEENLQDIVDHEIEEHEYETECETEIGIGKYVLVKYSTKKYSKYFVGEILHKDDDWAIKFLKYSKDKFYWPTQDDIDVVQTDDIVRILPQPTVERRGMLSFHIAFEGYKLE